MTARLYLVFLPICTHLSGLLYLEREENVSCVSGQNAYEKRRHLLLSNRERSVLFGHRRKRQKEVSFLFTKTVFCEDIGFSQHCPKKMGFLGLQSSSVCGGRMKR
uniref:Secreted protein n=1 Tax=Caenorhabditis tropicalis TaxID=1561998 RepID=A0A1I7UPP0_9PELO